MRDWLLMRLVKATAGTERGPRLFTIAGYDTYAGVFRALEAERLSIGQEGCGQTHARFIPLVGARAFLRIEALAVTQSASPAARVRLLRPFTVVESPGSTATGVVCVEGSAMYNRSHCVRLLCLSCPYAPSPVPIIDEAHVPAFADDDVVEDANAHEVAHLAETSSDLDVLLTWLG